jgi:hypothetical protein
MVEMALRRRRIYEVQDARSSILARVSLRPDTLAQTVQFGSQTPLADGAGHTFHHLRGRYRIDRPAEPRPQAHPRAYRLRLRGPFGAKAENEKHK